MKRFIKYITKTFFTVAILCGMFYMGLLHFQSKVKEDYSKLMQHSQKVLQVMLDKRNADLYMLCMLDYHINPNGKDMLSECAKIENIKENHPQLNTKIETPYYDFYMQYMQGILQ